MKRPKSHQLVILSFSSAIFIGTFLLYLPIAVKGERLSLIDSLFTATSAVCVTGLSVMDIGSFLSSFGRWIVFALFQIGGLGIMTFSTLFAVMLGRKIGFQETDVIMNTLDKRGILGLGRLISYILCITVSIELIGALFLFLRWRSTMPWGMLASLENAVFHAVSAFCNAGFSLFHTSLEQFRSDPYINLIMIMLIFLGGIGFVVISDILKILFKKGLEKRISLQSKIVLATSGVLIGTGAGLLLFFEKDNIMAAMSLSERLLGSFFQSVTARTAGFNTLPIGGLTVPSLLLIVSLMFIGASPGSTGGGIKTCTAAIIAASIYGMLKNNRRTKLFNRSIPNKIVREALIIFFLALSWIFVVTVILCYIETNHSMANGSFIKYLFEVISAFGTVGLSTGITSGLTSAGKLCIIMTMFVGRVGPLTLMLSVAFKEERETYILPEETVMVG